MRTWKLEIKGFHGVKHELFCIILKKETYLMELFGKIVGEFPTHIKLNPLIYQMLWLLAAAETKFRMNG